MALQPSTKPVRIGERITVTLVLWMCCGTPTPALAQKWHDEGSAFRRVASVSGSPLPEVIVCQFFSHHALDGGSRDVAVFARRDQVPCQLLQAGPGDMCRVAFQTAPGEPRYSVYYGGKPKSGGQAPQWSPRCGLLMETRRWKACDVGSLDSIRAAFEASEPIGGDFVPQVFHRFNPFSGEAAPFLSRYSGSLQVPVAGKCSFFTSSQDASFLVVDGQVAVSAPGVHPPQHVARWKGDVTLAEGPHRFEYYHAATGAEACMVAAWQLPGVNTPSPIPATAFGQDRVAHLPAGELEHRENGFLPDFAMAVVSDLPTPDGDSALVRVQFANRTPQEIARNAKYVWLFGDGQTSAEEHPSHVYLHPGLYEVELRMTRGLRNLSLRTSVHVPRQFVQDAKELQAEQKLADYLAVLDQYQTVKLDALGLQRLVMTYLDADRPEKAIEAAKAAFAAEAKQTDESRWTIASVAAPTARFQLGDSRAAGEMWYAASRQISRPEWRFACAVQAADILVNDLLSPNKARTVLDSVKDQMGEASPEARSHCQRIQADCYARTGDGENGRAALAAAVKARKSPFSVVERDARRGAYSRSTEAFLQSREYVRARTELEQWQLDFPSDKSEGYLSLLLMRYWMATRKYDQAIAVAGDLITLNRSSAYADRLLLMTAECEEQLGRSDRAAASLQSLVTDYPGSALVNKAKTEMARLRQSVRGAPDTTNGKASTPQSPSAPGKERKP